MGSTERGVVFFDEENPRIESPAIRPGICYEISITIDIPISIVGCASKNLKCFDGRVFNNIEYIFFREWFRIKLFDDVFCIRSEEVNGIIGIVIFINSAVLHKDSRDATDGNSEDNDPDEDGNERFSSFWFCEMKHIGYNASKDIPIISKIPWKKNEK